MKNYIKLFGIITLAVVIGFSFLSCEEPETIVDMTSGSLTIRGLSAFNDKEVIAYGYIDNAPTFMAGKELTTDGTTVKVTYAKVINNVATLQVWKCNPNFNQFTAFAEPPSQGVEFRVVCIETRDELRKTNPNAYGVVGTLTVYFTGQGGQGVGEGNFTAVTPY